MRSSSAAWCPQDLGFRDVNVIGRVTDRLHTVKTLVETGIFRPSRPDKLTVQINRRVMRRPAHRGERSMRLSAPAVRRDQSSPRQPATRRGEAIHCAWRQER